MMELCGFGRMWWHWWMEQGDWMTEYESAYSGAEAFVCDQPQFVESLLVDVDLLLASPDESARKAALEAAEIELEGLGPESGALDEFLVAVRDRCRRHLSGDDSRPLVDPPSDDEPHPPYVADQLDEDQHAHVLQQVLAVYGELVRAHDEPGSGATPVLRVPVPELRLGAVVALTGERVAAPIGCLVVHHHRSHKQEWTEMSVWVEPERAAPPPMPALQLLFGAYYRPTWKRDWGLAHLPPWDFRGEQPASVVAEALDQIKQLWTLPDEEARRVAVLELGSYQVPRLERRIDRLLITVQWQLERIRGW